MPAPDFCSDLSCWECVRSSLLRSRQPRSQLGCIGSLSAACFLPTSCCPAVSKREQTDELGPSGVAIVRAQCSLRIRALGCSGQGFAFCLCRSWQLPGGRLQGVPGRFLPLDGLHLWLDLCPLREEFA